MSNFRFSKITVSIIVSICILSCNNPAKIKAEKQLLHLKLVATDLCAPVSMDCPKDGSGRLFICEQSGKIRIMKNGRLLTGAFLDINKNLAELNKKYSEKGLLGLAFHPEFKSNGRFFIYYSASVHDKNYDHKSIISEYRVSSNPDSADQYSERILMEIAQPEENHNGGQLAFGPDGMLYIGSGDGGGANDEHGKTGNGQNMQTILGKILRIDINSTFPYSIPPDNPFIKDMGAKAEIWVYGMRNPWRFSFDRNSGQLFCADVGQNEWEEIDIIQKGKNYGWRIMEGTHCFNPKENCDKKDIELPIAEYNHETGICIIGGFVYGGEVNKQLTGKYIFADWTGKLFYLEEIKNRWEMKSLILDDKKDNDMGENINSFGEDENGELYILSQKSVGPFETNGSVYLITSDGS